MSHENHHQSRRDNHHILLVAGQAQGHINPTLQLAKRLARAGVRVTFSTTSNGLRSIKIPSNNIDDRLSFAALSTGFDDGVKPSDDPRYVAEESRRVGSNSLRDLILSLSVNQGRPISLLVYTLMLPWAADVARDLHVPSAFLFIQSAAAFAIYKRFFSCHGSSENTISPESCIKLPGLPPLECGDLPTFLLPSSPHYFVCPILEDHIRALEREPNPTVLINTFDALEEPAIKAAVDIDHVKMITIGPLIPSGFSDMEDPEDKSYGCDLFECGEEEYYMSWLGSKAEKSVVYVSFGSMVAMRRKLFEEILHGLTLMGRPYLWVVRPKTHHKIVGEEDEVVIDDDIVKCINQLGLGLGLIVPWCSQVEVLSHPSIGCFVTHCGWNSVLESLVMGVPMIGVPLISDQPTNAKLVSEVWVAGVRARVNDDSFVDREELRRCIEVVMIHDGEFGEEIRKNVRKWMELARQALIQGGSSDNHLACFLECLQDNQIQEI